jgi:hypothetical protein
MNTLGAEVAELQETANLLHRTQHWPLCNGLDFLSRNGNLISRQSVAQVL